MHTSLRNTHDKGKPVAISRDPGAQASCLQSVREHAKKFRNHSKLNLMLKLCSRIRAQGRQDACAPG
ncbi:MAG: hypothetical protein WCB68_08750, partial [Pyrinomonadaceae bacterium]